MGEKTVTERKEIKEKKEEKEEKVGTDQSGDEGNPNVPEVLVEQPAVYHVTKQSNGSWFAQTTSRLGFYKTTQVIFHLYI